MSSQCWEFLGIAPTCEQSAIKQAYARLLRQHHPEDDPEGFQQLRAAYEQALQEAQHLLTAEVEAESVAPGAAAQPPADEAPAPAESRPAASSVARPALKAMQQAWHELYTDFSRRVHVEEWQALLASPTLQDWDTRQSFAIWAFGFLGHHRYVPAAVKQLLQETFDWAYRIEVLEQAYGEEAVQDVLDFLEYRQWQLGFEQVRLHGYWDLEQIDDHLLHRDWLVWACRHDDQEAMDKCFAVVEQATTTDPELLNWLISWFLERDQLQEALRYAQRLQGQLPDSLDALLQLGRIQMHLQDYHAAATCFRAALDIDEANVLATKGLAHCFLQAGYLWEARETYAQAQELAAFDMESHIRIQQINLQLIEQDFAGLQSERYSAQFCCEVAECYLQIGDHQRCIDFVDEIAARARSNASLLLRLFKDNSGLRHPEYRGTRVPARLYELQGDTYRQLGQREEAIKAYKKAVKQARRDKQNGFAVQLKLTECAFEKGEFFKAWMAATKLQDIDPQHAGAWFWAAHATSRGYPEDKKLLKGALKEIDTAIRLDPAPWLYYSVRAQILHGLERFEEELADLLVILRHDDSFAAGWYRKAHCLNRLGRLEDAVEALEKAISWGDVTREASRFLVRILIELQRPEQARQVLDTCRISGVTPQTIRELEQAILQLEARQHTPLAAEPAGACD